MEIEAAHIFETPAILTESKCGRDPSADLAQTIKLLRLK
jgi:hypothetical protein